MIKADSNKGHTELRISGDLVTVLSELHIIITNLLESSQPHGLDFLVLQEIVDATEEFKASITNKKFNSKGENKDD